MISQDERQTLMELLRARSVRTGDFVLASGARSTYYIDARLTTMSPEGLTLIGPLALAELQRAGWRLDAVGGLTLGADPIAYAIAYASALAGTPLRAFTVRKEPKAHGTGKRVEGCFAAGDEVVVIEDTVTTGGSAIKAIHAVEAEGGKVLAVLALVDREQGGREAIERAGYAGHALVRVSDLLARSNAQGDGDTGE